MHIFYSVSCLSPFEVVFEVEMSLIWSEHDQMFSRCVLSRSKTRRVDYPGLAAHCSHLWYSQIHLIYLLLKLAEIL